MKRRKSDSSLRREKLRANLIHLSIALSLLFIFTIKFSYQNTEKEPDDNEILYSNFISHKIDDIVRVERQMIEKEQPLLSSLYLDGTFINASGENGFPGFLHSVVQAFETGTKLWREINHTVKPAHEPNQSGSSWYDEACPGSVSRFGPKAHLVELPCGLKMGSQVIILGTPKKAWPKFEEGLYTMVSQFKVELRGLRAVDGEDPPRIFHFNPRVKGDRSGKPTIEMNTCYRMKWANGIRCEGLKSNDDDGTVDGEVQCDKWANEEPLVIQWFKKLTGLTDTDAEWTFPLKEEKLFVLTLRAGSEGYHVAIDGKHVSSFPYHKAFTLEDATGLSIEGDVDVHCVYVASLPTSHPNNEPERLLEMSSHWTTRPLLYESPEMFVGIISVGNHFAERMAIRKSWMQHPLIKSSKVVVRFFVAMHAKKKVNAMVKKEAEFYRDIVIVPYMDNYNLVVLKTIAIAEYGVNVVNAKYVMKGDDDTFVRIDAIMDKIKKADENQSLYFGKINKDHKVMRSGKWAVTYEEWPGDLYPHYADGPGYIMTSDIAKFVISQFNKHKLKLFRMEDVSMGMWVEQFNNSKAVVNYIHNDKFSQSGCIEDYITAHYQSPKQMICLWNILQKYKRPQCCDL